MSGTTDALPGLRVVWDTPAFDPRERAQVERLLSCILTESLVAAFGRASAPVEPVGAAPGSADPRGAPRWPPTNPRR